MIFNNIHMKARNYLAGCFVTMSRNDGPAVLAYTQAEDPNEITAYTSPDFDKFTEITDRTIAQYEFKVPPLGYCEQELDAKYPRYAYLRRDPMRAWKVGLSNKNTNNLPRGPVQHQFALIERMVKGVYPDFRRALELVKIKGNTVAFNRYYALTRTKEGIMMMLRGEEVGLVNPQGTKLVVETESEMLLYSREMRQLGVNIIVDFNPPKRIDYNGDI